MKKWKTETRQTVEKSHSRVSVSMRVKVSRSYQSVEVGAEFSDESSGDPETRFKTAWERVEKELAVKLPEVKAVIRELEKFSGASG